MTAVHGSKAQILLTTTPSLSMTNQALTDSGDHTTFNITNAATKRYWDATVAISFETSTDGSTWTPATPVVVQYIGGKVTFSGVIGGTHQARIASGSYLPYAAIADAQNYGFSLVRDEKENTSFTTSSTPTRERTWTPGLVGGTFKFKHWEKDDTFATGIIQVDTKDTLIASLVLDVTATPPTRLECFGWLTKDSIQAMVDDLNTEDLEFRISGNWYLVNN